MIARIFALLFLASGCAYFVNTFDENRLAQDIVAYKPPQRQLFCESKSDFQLVNSSKESQAAFRTFLERARKRTRLSGIDEVVTWSLAQMNLRPDLATPTSKLQVLIGSGKKFDYFHYYSKEENSYPYLAGLEDLLKRYRSKHSLSTLAKLVDAYYPNIHEVGAQFEEFLKENKFHLSQNEVLKKHYMRADETLQEKEKIPKYPLAKIVGLLSKSNRNVSYEVSKSLFTYKESSAISAHCNYDMKLYSSSVYLIHKDFIRSHLFGLRSGNFNFMASTSQRMDKIEPLGKSIFFKGSSQTRSAAFCAFDFPKNKDSKLWLVSTDSRDPGQHIYHLMEYGLETASELKDVSELIGFARHLFLEDPTRLIFESNRSSKDQLERLLKLNLPVYNARKLGNVWGMFNGPELGGFVVDDRSDGEISCD